MSNAIIVQQREGRLSTVITHWPLFPILLLAALLRLVWPGLSPFGYDEARLSALALEWVQGGGFPLAGMISSVGLRNPPLSVYLFALPYALTPDPLGAVLFVGLSNILAVAASYALAQRWYGPRAAWITALLFAVAPWSLLYSRWIWAQSLLPPLVLLTVAAGYLALVEERPRWFVVLPLALALTVQLHLSGVALALWAGAALLCFWRRIRWRPLLLGGLLALLSWLPYFIYLLLSWGQEQGHLQGALQQPARLDGEALLSSWLILSGSQIHSLAGPARYEGFLASLPPYEGLFALLGLLILASLGWLLGQLWRGEGRPREIALLLLLWLVAPLLLHSWHRVEIHPHYFIVLFPAPFLALGGASAALGRARPRWGQALTFLVLLIALSQWLVFAALLRFVAAQATPGGLGVPLRYWREAAARADQPTCSIQLIGPGSWPDYHALPATFELLLQGDPRLHFREAAVQETLPPYADGRSLLLVPPPPPDAAGYAEALPDAPSSLPDVALRPGEGAIRLLYDDGGREEARLHAQPPTRFANGMVLLGYGLRGPLEPGQTVRLFLHWQLGPAPEGDELYGYNHLLAADGTRIAQADGYLCPRDQWPSGQQVWLWYDLPLPPDAPAGPYSLRSGLYHYPVLHNVPVLDAQGQPADDGVTLVP